MVYRESLHLPVLIHKTVFKDAKKKGLSLANTVLQKLAEKFDAEVSTNGKHKLTITEYPKSQRVTVTLPEALYKKIEAYRTARNLKRTCEAVYIALQEAYELPLAALATKHTGRRIKK